MYVVFQSTADIGGVFLYEWHKKIKRIFLHEVPPCPCGRGAVVERTPSVTKVVSSILAQSERDFVGGRERTL